MNPSHVKMTPMLRQYLELKEQAGSALLLYRMGDFYELFFEDAQVAAPVLGITLTRRRQNDSLEAPMCGVPHHAFDGYLGKLLEAGFRVAVAEQVEDPATAKGLVRREIIRMHTPGTISDTELLDGVDHCYLAAVGGDDEMATVAWIEISTGTFEGLRSADNETVAEHLARLNPKEVLHSSDWEGWTAFWPEPSSRPTLTPLATDEFSPSTGEQRLRRVLGVSSLHGFGLESGETLVGMAGALIGYVESTQRGALNHLCAFVCREAGDAMVVDRSSLRNLEVERAADGGRVGALVEVLDHSITPMGGRLLRDRLVRPAVDLDEIDERHRAVAELVDDDRLLQTLRGSLEGMPDLARLAGRVGLVLATPRELQALRTGLDLLPGVRDALANATSNRLRQLSDRLDPMKDLAEVLHRRVAAEPAQVPGAGVMADGWDATLDEYRRLAMGGKELLAEVEARERERTKISSLKVRYNKVFGYFIEVSKANLDRVPEAYERRQTLTNAERFVTPELKDLEAKILTAEEGATARDRELFQQLIEELTAESQRIAATADVVARLDVHGGFADRARRWSYCRPVMRETPGVSIRDGRHPVLEALQKDPPFIPNDCELDPSSAQIVLLTGPNMGGKSTYLRQVALMTLMAHAGSFVPAGDAVIGRTDRIFTRVGASDRLAKGESTFMVEMTETANILHHATPRSLVILDEVGRGTATFDGLSLAWAIVEYLHDREEHAALVLFATHYHELTELSRMLPRLVNRSMAVKEWRGSIIFLHRVVEGPADHSYGIHVARLAGVPGEVCGRAEQVLGNIEQHELHVAGDPVMLQPDGGPADRINQLDLFRTGPNPISERIRGLDIDAMKPIEALNLLAELRASIDDEH
jgi:DNA mismatch repair protein MutS